MTIDDDEERLLRLLGHLPMSAPDAARAERTRQRCRTALRARQRQLPTRPAGFVRRVVEPAVVAGFMAVYLTAVVLDVLRWRGAF